MLNGDAYVTHQIPPSRFYSLDVLRGIAALSVVFWHWQHFFIPFNIYGALFSADKEPLFKVFFVFYKHGNLSVQLFFCLSGFIFFWLYSKPVNEGTVTVGSFSVLRLSRLYPLHFATLIFTTICQLTYISITGVFFAYSSNNIYHFLLNLFFASSWGFQGGLSFNAPAWSVSIEVMLYTIFFVFCRIFRPDMRTLLFTIVTIIAAQFSISVFGTDIGTGMGYFFLGGLTFTVYERIIKTGDSWRVSIWLPLATCIGWLVIVVAMIPANGFTLSKFPWNIQKMICDWTSFILFSITIMSLALIETKRGTLGKRLSSLGDISYSLYLLHFPLQLALVTVATKLAIDQALFYSPWFMALFFSFLISLSFASHRYFEVPMQRFLRRQP